MITKEKKISFLLGFYAIFVLTIAVYVQGFQPSELIFISIFLLLPFLIWSIRNYHSTWHIPISWLFISVLLFWIWMALSLFWAVVPALGLHMFCFLSSLPLAFFAYFLFRKNNFWPYFILFVLILGLLLACKGLFQVYVIGLSQVSSFFHDPNSFAAFLNMIVLLGSAAFLSSFREKRVYSIFTILVLALLFYVIGLEASRGVFIGLVTALFFLCLFTYRAVPRSAIVILILIAVVFWLLGDLSSYMSMVEKFSGGYSQRWIIWKASWQLLKASPWYGIGVGNYMPLYTAFSPPADLSAHQYAHNDYLQIWIELGYPGILLLLSVMLSATFTYIIFIRKKIDDHQKIIEVTGLFAAMLAIAVHSFVTFNFYVTPILILFGFVLARFHDLALSYYHSIKFSPAKMMRKLLYYLILSAIFLFIFIRLSSYVLSYVYIQKGLSSIKRGALQNGQIYFSISAKWYPWAYAYYYHAVLLMPALNSTHFRDKKIFLYHRILFLLKKANACNPVDSDTWMQMGILYSDYPRFKRLENKALAQKAFQKAVYFDPSNYKARYQYAKFLIKNRQNKQAFDLLTQGFPYGFVAVDNAGINIIKKYTVLYQRLANMNNVGQIALRYQKE